MKISNLIKVHLNLFHWTGCGTFPDFSRHPDLQRARDPRQIWKKVAVVIFASWGACSVVLAELGWWASKHLEYARISAFTFKRNGKRDEHMAVFLTRSQWRSSFHSPPTHTGGHQLYLCRSSQALGGWRPQKNPNVTESCWSSSTLQKWTNCDWSQLTDVNQGHF